MKRIQLTYASRQDLANNSTPLGKAVKAGDFFHMFATPYPLA